jgi:molybdate transport system substrate-binding protein
MRSRASWSWRATLLAALLLAGTACAGGDPETGDEVLLVFAAASLTDAFTDLAAEFEATEGRIDVQLNLGGSSSLREQILQGAPADVFASASEPVMEDLVAAGTVTGTPTVVATNDLQLVVPAGNPADVRGLADLARDDILVGLCAAGVPCGDLARRALDAAGVEAAVDTEEPDVRALLTKVAAGELDAGIVYRTDVRAAGERVEGLDLPADARQVTRYPVAVLGGSAAPVAAASFVAFVQSDRGRAILASYGFGPP